jgi:hypothetical protein
MFNRPEQLPRNEKQNKKVSNRQRKIGNDGSDGTLTGVIGTVYLLIKIRGLHGCIVRIGGYYSSIAELVYNAPAVFFKSRLFIIDSSAL